MNSSPVDTFPDSPFVWRDLTWPERQPVAKVEPMAGGAPTGEVVRVRVTPNMALGVVLLDETFDESGLWCSGFAHAELDDAGSPSFRTVPCPRTNRLARGQQCPLCMHLDRFRPIHRAHQGAELTEAARAYIELPHWLYVATFPDGTSKVGTAHERSKTTRVDQQAVARASYVALADDGLIVRHLEDHLTRALGLTQVKRVASKVRAWSGPEDPREIDDLHAAAAEGARRYLERLEEPGFRVAHDDWSPAESMLDAYEHLERPSDRPLHPHASWEGPELFRVASGTGPFLTAALVQDPGAGDYLLNTASLKNRASMAVQDDGSTTVQTSLF